MTRVKKIITILISIAMILSIFPIQAYAKNVVDTITVNNTMQYTYDWNNDDFYHYYKFVPTKTSTYSVKIFTDNEKTRDDDGAISLTLQDSNGEEIKTSTWNSALLSSTLKVKLQANKTYYFYVECWQDQLVDISINVTSLYKSVSLSATKYTYDGKAKKPTVTVKDANGNKISSSNYTVSYSSGRKNVGQYYVTVKFNDGSETKKITFTIYPKSTSISTLTAKSKGFTIKWKKYTTQTTGYQIQYATDSKFTKNTKTTTVSKNSTTSKTISKLSGKKKYYVRIRTYKTVNGTKYYSSWSSSKTVTTKK